MEADKQKIIELIEPLLWDTTITAEQAYIELNSNSDFGNQMKARLLGYIPWYKLISQFDVKTVFQWVDDNSVKPKVWPKEVFNKYESIRRILSK